MAYKQKNSPFKQGLIPDSITGGKPSKEPKTKTKKKRKLKQSAIPVKMPAAKPIKIK